MPPQGHDAAAWPAHVAQQQLQDRAGADHLRAGGVLGEADGVAPHRRALAPRVLHQLVGDGLEVLRRDAADALDHLRRVAAEVALEDLEDAAGVLQRLVALELARVHARARALLEALRGVLARTGRRRHLAALVHPRTAVVHPRLGVEAAEQPAEVLRVLEVLAHERRGVRVVDDVVLEVALRLEHVADEAAEERDVRARADGEVQVGELARAAVARVDVDDLRAALLGLHHPAEADRVRLGHVGALDQDAVSVLDVLQV